MLSRKAPEIDGVRVTKVTSATDARGSFVKFHPSQEFEDSLDSIAFSVNPNVGTIRGMHFQVEPFAEEKLVTCAQGRIFDVAVDLRPNSETFGMWTSFELSATNALQLYLPKGIAHGFQTLENNTILMYNINGKYKKSYESGFLFNDPYLNIKWPLTIKRISMRDQKFKPLKENPTDRQ